MQILKIALVSLLFISCKHSDAQKSDSAYGKPLIVLLETDPWLMAIGSDVASFVLYESGQIIYKSLENKVLKTYEVSLNQTELENVIHSLEISDDFYKLKEDIEASNWTDQPSNILTIEIKQKKIVNVYGRISSNPEARKKTPQAFLVVYDNIKKFKNQNAKPWVPNTIEVMFWDYNYAPNKKPWIKGFPDLNSSNTIKFDNDSYSVFLKKEHFDEFFKFYSSLGEKEAVEINGRKMAISYRMPFPNLK